MAYLNSIQIIGRLGVDPVVKNTTTGKTVCKFSVAVNRPLPGGEDGARNQATDWFNVEVWGTQAEFAAKYLKKGRLVYVSGRIQIDQYQTQAGETRYWTKLVGLQIQALDKAPQQVEELVEELVDEEFPF
jgi:single-strand DNA-binding protein